MSQANNNGSAFAGYTGYIQPNAGQPRLPRREAGGHHGRADDDVRPVHPDPAGAGDRRRAGRQEDRAGRPGHDAHRHATFVVLLIGVVILVGALTFFPALLLGPIVQSLTTHLF